MKYFTKEWWGGRTSDAAAKQYWPYIDTVRPRLTKDLIRLLDEVSLHDSNVSSFLVLPEEETAVLVLDGSSDPWCCKKEPDRPRQFTLRYEHVAGVTITDGSGSPLSELDKSDLGYDEIELLSENLFQHRMLFDSGTELHVTFKGFSLAFVDHHA